MEDTSEIYAIIKYELRWINFELILKDSIVQEPQYENKRLRYFKKYIFHNLHVRLIFILFYLHRVLRKVKVQRKLEIIENHNRMAEESTSSYYTYYICYTVHLIFILF